MVGPWCAGADRLRLARRRWRRLALHRSLAPSFTRSSACRCRTGRWRLRFRRRRRWHRAAWAGRGRRSRASGAANRRLRHGRRHVATGGAGVDGGVDPGRSRCPWIDGRDNAASASAAARGGRPPRLQPGAQLRGGVVTSSAAVRESVVGCGNGDCARVAGAGAAPRPYARHRGAAAGRGGGRRQPGTGPSRRGERPRERIDRREPVRFRLSPSRVRRPSRPRAASRHQRGQRRRFLVDHL